MTPLLLLAEKVEGLEGPDRSVECEIQLWGANKGRLGSFSTPEAWLESANKYGWGYMKYTASLDAAMSLVPEGWQIDLGDWAIEGDDDVRAGICWTATMEPYNRGKGVHADAATPALALCAAALRARAAMEAGE